MAKLKEDQSELMILLAIGGWDLSAKLDIISSATMDGNTKTFTRNVVEFLRKHDADGLHLDLTHVPTKGFATVYSFVEVGANI